jgi:hypothetical protein
LSLYTYFVTAPYAVLAIEVAMLFIYSGLVNRVDNKKHQPCFSLFFAVIFAH